MRGAFFDLGKLFSYLSPEARVPARHPLGEALRKRRTSLDRSAAIVERIAVAGVLRHPIGTTADGTIGLQSFVPLVRGTFARRPGLGPDHVYEEPGPAAERVFAKFMTKLLNHPQVKPLLSDEHFSVDGTLIEAWASQKSFRPKDGSGDGNGGANFHGQKRKNDTHASTTDPDSRLYRKAAGREAKLSYMGHATTENRHGLAVAGMVTHANGSAERRASEIMLKARSKAVGRRITAGEDKAYDTADHVANLRASNITPHVTQNDSPTKTGKRRKSAIDGRTTQHEGYGMSRSRRATIECIFGWGKQHGTMRRTKHRGICRVAADFMLNLIAYNLIRIPKLIAA